MTKVWDHSTQKGSTLLLLLALADHAADDGFCWPGVARLAKKIRMSERSVMRKIQDLERDKELAVSRSHGEHNWYVVRLGMTDEEVKQIFSAHQLEWASAPRYKPGDRQGIYVIEGNGYYKIGHAIDLDRRIAQLNTQLPVPVKTICIIQSDDYIELERGLHERFADARANGEWFKLERHQIAYLQRLERRSLDENVTSDILSPPSDTATPTPLTEQCHPNHQEPSSIRQEDPATPGSPPADGLWDKQVAAIGEEPSQEEDPEIAETEAMFIKTSDTKLSKEQFESRHNGVAAVTGQEMKVSHDIPGQPWCNEPVEAWCKLAGKSYVGMSIPTRIKLGGIFFKVGTVTNGTPAQVAEAIGNFKAEHEWWKYDFDWPSDGFLNRLGMMLVPDAAPEPGETLVSVQPAEPTWLGEST
jgi:hypothetical protein